MPAEQSEEKCEKEEEDLQNALHERMLTGAGTVRPVHGRQSSSKIASKRESDVVLADEFALRVAQRRPCCTNSSIRI